MNRRGFLGSILALGAAPAIVRADSLMRIVPRETLLITGELYYLDKFQFYESPDVLITKDFNPLLEDIVREALRITHEKASFIASINKQGETIRIRKPNRYAGGA